MSDNKRKLAAILFADIQGYTAMMQTQESQALQVLKRFQSVIQKSVSKHNGELVKSYGDGSLVIFNSTIDAMNCAFEMQKAFREEPKVPLRVGLHVGEVIKEEGDYFGNGINIASRIESMGTAGTILFSKDVAKRIKNQPEFKMQSLGSYTFKHVEDPIEVYALNNNGFPVPNVAEIKGKFQSSQASKSLFQKYGWVGLLLLLGMVAGSYFFRGNSVKNLIPDDGLNAMAIFPFDVKGASDINYLGEGIVDLISTKLDEIPDVNSIDPNLIFSRLEEQSGITRNPEKAAELSQGFGAKKFVLGSIVELSGQLEISASKYDASGQLVTKVKVDADKSENLVQAIDELARKLLIDELDIEGQEYSSLALMTSQDFESLSHYLKGEQAYRAGNFDQAISNYREAVEKDSSFALAWLRIRDAAAWRLDVSGEEAYRQVQINKSRLPQKLQEYVEALFLYSRADPKAEDAFRQLIRKYGESRDLLNMLAECLVHFNQIYGRSFMEAKPYLQKTRYLDKNNMEALLHLGHIAIMERDTMALKAMVEEVDPQSESWPDLQLNYLVRKDTVTDAEIMAVANHEYFRSENLFTPLLFLILDGDPGFRLAERFFRVVQDEEIEAMYRSYHRGVTGQEQKTLATFQQLSQLKTRFFFDYNMDRLCIPATLMVDQQFLPLSEQYQNLYEELNTNESARGIYAAIKYCLALNKGQECRQLKEKLKSMTQAEDVKGIWPGRNRDQANYYLYSLEAFEARQEGNNDRALAMIDTALTFPAGYWVSQTSCLDKTLLRANIYYDQGQYEKAIQTLEYPSFWLGYPLMSGYATYRLTDLYEKTGQDNKALEKCNILLENYKNCDPKYQPWVEEIRQRRDRIMSKSL